MKFQTTFILTLILILIVWVSGQFIGLMDIDAAQYAANAKEMFYNHSYLEVYMRGSDYLDKPPLLFWSSCFSYKIFGINTFAYRLPSLIILIAGLYAQFRIAIKYFSADWAKLSIIVSASCQAYFLMIHDVRTDTMLTGFTLLSIWQLHELLDSLKWKNVLGFAICTAGAMMTKGPIGFMIPAIFAFFKILWDKNWKLLIHYKFWASIIIIGLMLVPMCYGLYHQFDLHPEKDVYGLNGPSGLRFYFWIQSFGRLTGENQWNNNPDPFFLYHSFLWSFLPWTLIFIPSIYYSVKHIVIKKYRHEKINTITLTFMCVFFMMSRSTYQLPHYTFTIHPLASLILINYLSNLHLKKSLNYIKYSSIFLIIILYFVGIIISIIPFNIQWQSIIILFAGLVTTIFILIQWKSNNLILQSIVFLVISASSVNIVLNNFFYPKILTYQSETAVANYLNEKEITDLYTYKTVYWHALDFYYKGKIIPCKESQQIPIQKGKFILVEQSKLNECRDSIPFIQIEKEFIDYPVTNLSPEFLNPNTREATLTKMYLCRLKL